MKCRKFSNSNGYNIRLTSSPRYQSAQDADGIVLSVFARTGREDAVLHPNLSLESETLKKAGFTAHCTSCHIGFSPGQIDSKIRRHWQLYKGKPHRRRTWPKVENPRTSQGISRLSSSSYRPDNGPGRGDPQIHRKGHHWCRHHGVRASFLISRLHP